jgi:threonine/homoserine/homoserine lactone efflux protein
MGVAAGIGQSVAALLLAATVIMGSPGPSTMSATAVGAAYGFRRALPYVGGLILGTSAVLLAVALGVVAVVLAIPHGRPLLLGVSAVYILYLAWRIACAPPLARHDGTVAAPALPGGFLLAVANPKAYLAIGAVFAGVTVLPADPATEEFGLLAAMIVAIHLAWLLAGASLARWLHDPLASRVVNVTLAVALVATTVLALLA